jgi:putative membrane protein
MAWVRTSLSLLSFGFTIYKILKEVGGDKNINVAVTPETAGLFLAGMGTLAMVMGTVDYWHTLRELNQDARFSFRRPQLVMATVMTMVGVGLFVGIATHVV